MEFRKVVGFIGPIGCGKSLAASVAAGMMINATILPFAKPLKSMLSAAGLTAEELYGVDKERPSPLLGGKTPRYAMQTLGTEWGRNTINPNIWVNIWARQVSCLSAPGFVFADDARFPNEIAAIRNLGGTVVKIVRPSSMVRNDEHASERSDELDYDLLLNNDGDVKKLRTQLFGILNKI